MHRRRVEPLAAHRRGAESLADRLLEVSAKLREAAERSVVGLFEGHLAVAFLGHDDVVHEHDAALPVVERDELADDRDDRVGEAEVVEGRGAEALDLAHDVVAEIADEATVKWRQVL